MTINIGSKKIGRIAIGQSDGTVKDIKQMNLGEKIIFKKGLTPGQKHYKLPTNINNNAFYFTTDRIEGSGVNYLYIDCPFRAKVTIKVWYDGEPDRNPDYTTTLDYNASNTNVSLSGLVSAMTNKTLIAYEIGTWYSWGMTNNWSGKGLIQAVKDTTANVKGVVYLNKTPIWSTYIGSPNPVPDSCFKNFNANASIYDMEDDCFELTSSVKFGTNCFENFNANGCLERLGKNFMDTSKVSFQTSGSTIFANFNGTASTPGKLSIIQDGTNYNQVMKNISPNAQNVYDAKTQTLISVAPGTLYKFKS